MARLPKRKHNLSKIFSSILGVFVLIGIIVGILALGWGYWHRVWDGKSRFTLISFAPHLVVKSFDPASNTGVILNFPDNLAIESISGRGSWMANVIGKAGGEKWAADSVANYLGINYTAVDHLGWFDQLQWSWRGKSIDWSTIDLVDSPILQKQLAPDGVATFHLTTAWDTKAKLWFFDQNIANKSLGVIIVNTTTAPGLGANASRVVESMGFKVRNLTNSPDQVDQCVVRTLLDLKKTLPVQKLIKAFNCKWEVSEESDLTLILGNLYRSWKTGD